VNFDGWRGKIWLTFIVGYCVYVMTAFFFLSTSHVEAKIKSVLVPEYSLHDLQEVYGVNLINKTELLQRYCGSLNHDGLTFGDESAILNPNGEVPFPSVPGRTYGTIAYITHGQVPVVPFLLGYYTRTDFCFSKSGTLIGYKTRRFFSGILYFSLPF
jgi:hypothetical protein